VGKEVRERVMVEVGFGVGRSLENSRGDAAVRKRLS
jgi:hypothetical protein